MWGSLLGYWRRPEEMVNVAVFMASDHARGIAGTTLNLTMGNLDD
jgi:NAD(P)-dependent dehydrogenase (short-subunit alcohol dehydrogenase family)